MNITYLTQTTASSPRPTQFMPYVEPATHSLLPSAIGSEKALIKMLLLHPTQTMDEINKANIAYSLFTHIPHQTIYRELLLGISMGSPHDLTTLTQKLWGVLPTLGGAFYLTEIVTGDGLQSNTAEYIRLMKRVATHREIIALTTSIGQEIVDPSIDLEITLEKLKQSASGLSFAPRESNRPSLSSSIASALEFIQSGGNSLADVRSGISTLDDVVKMMKGNLIVIGGPAKGGKTSLAMTILLNTIKDNQRAIFHSLEMSPTEIATRLLSMDSEVPTAGLSAESITQAQLDALSCSATRLASLESNLEVVSDIFDFQSIISHVKTSHATAPIDLVVVDYVQLVETSQDKAGNRQEAVASVSRGLKRLAAELNVVVVALSQLNDNGELRESRALGMDANAVIKVIVDKTTYDRSVLVEMQRSGPSNCMIECTYCPELTLFKNGPARITPQAAPASAGNMNFMRNLMGLPPVAPVSGVGTQSVMAPSQCHHLVPPPTATREELDQLHSQLFDDEEVYADEAHFSQEDNDYENPST